MSRIDRLLSWFPANWKARYGIEVRDLLQSQPITWPVYRDLLVACADAWSREGAALALRFWASAWTLTVVAAVVASLAGLGWVVAREIHAAGVQSGFSGWLQSQVGPTFSGWLSSSRGILWFATGWPVLGWAWKLHLRNPGPKMIAWVLITFSALLVLDSNGPNFVDAVYFGAYLSNPFTARLQTFVAWMTGWRLTASPTDSVQP